MDKKTIKLIITADEDMIEGMIMELMEYADDMWGEEVDIRKENVK